MSDSNERGASDARVDPGDDARIMKPAQDDETDVLEYAASTDTPSSAEATDASYTAHADDSDGDGDPARPPSVTGD